jgi:hypothetical protein
MPISIDDTLKAIPEGWFLHDLGECVTPVRYYSDKHEPTGLFQCGLQCRDGGGKMTRANGSSLTDALWNAISAVHQKLT